MYDQPLHLIRSVQGLLPSSPSASPSLGCLPLVNRLGCPGSMPGRDIPFLECLLFNKLGCPGSTPSRGIPFPDCLLLFSRLGCPGSTPGRGIPFPDCLLLFNRLGCPSSTPGRGIPFPDCLLLFSPLHCTQSPGTVTHLSHTHYVCEAPPDNPLLLLLLLLLASYIAATHINFFSLSFLPSFLLHCHNQQHQFFLTTHYQMSDS